MQDIIKSVVETEKMASEIIKKAEAEAESVMEAARREAEQLRLDILNEAKAKKETILKEGEEEAKKSFEHRLDSYRQKSGDTAKRAQLGYQQAVDYMIKKAVGEE
ncbi:hypothetical protein [Acetivibrio sp. MSJd-27]|uniref:hypothetical protein n=1 Tax=Acetivibrio sp. MSJd-27 TaxID=2841523 RepID=UPI001C123BA3|nr:hypothetical protein [Acetivibrio sp. MSJd-27]MBU5450065.1 hypothetical protein [Acetivibrio sp. MSJd-27]